MRRLLPFLACLMLILTAWVESVTDKQATRMRSAFQLILKRRRVGTTYFNEGI